ncbi:hypothetical protein HDU93_003643, partial [Gonapodya sp. JEL0774]
MNSAGYLDLNERPPRIPRWENDDVYSSFQDEEDGERLMGDAVRRPPSITLIESKSVGTSHAAKMPLGELMPVQETVERANNITAPTTHPTSANERSKRIFQILASLFDYFKPPSGPITWSSIFADLRAATTGALVAVPLSLALAIACGGNPAQGMVTTFWAGFVAALTGGSEWNVIGPTFALAGILSGQAAQFGGGNALPYAAIHTAVIILAVWLFRLAKYLTFIVCMDSLAFF